MDTAGQDDYQTMIDSWIANVEAFILVYAIDDRESFESINSKHQRILKIKKGDTPPIIIVGNKCDIKTGIKVTDKEGRDLAAALKVDFLEVSALEKINVKECFLKVAEKLLYKKYPNLDPNKKNNKIKEEFCGCYII